LQCADRQRFEAFLLLKNVALVSASFPAALSRRFLVHGFAVTSTTGLFPTAMHRIHGCPGSAFRFIGRDTSLFVTFFDVFRLSLLFVSVFRLVPSWHDYLLRKSPAS
jgi:hypothetical protein